jgi:hypothetical protein
MSIEPATLKQGDLVKAKLPFREEPILLCFERAVLQVPGVYTYVFKPVLSVELTFQFAPSQVRGFEFL